MAERYVHENFLRHFACARVAAFDGPHQRAHHPRAEGAQEQRGPHVEALLGEPWHGVHDGPCGAFPDSDHHRAHAPIDFEAALFRGHQLEARPDRGGPKGGEGVLHATRDHRGRVLAPRRLGLVKNGHQRAQRARPEEEHLLRGLLGLLRGAMHEAVDERRQTGVARRFVLVVFALSRALGEGVVLLGRGLLLERFARVPPLQELEDHDEDDSEREEREQTLPHDPHRRRGHQRRQGSGLRVLAENASERSSF